MAVLNDTADNWAGVGVSSGTGFLSVVYSLFINKPSRKIRKNTNHLMRLKVIFLGYLRELTQMDQSFSKNLMDNDNISQHTLESFVTKIKASMTNSLNALRWEEVMHLPDEAEMKKKILEDIEKSEKKPQRTVGTLFKKLSYWGQDGKEHTFESTRLEDKAVGGDESEPEPEVSGEDSSEETNSEDELYQDQQEPIFSGLVSEGSGKINYIWIIKKWSLRRSRTDKISSLLKKDDGENKKLSEVTEIIITRL